MKVWVMRSVGLGVLVFLLGTVVTAAPQPDMPTKAPATPEAALLLAAEGLADGREEPLLSAVQITGESEKAYFKALTQYLRTAHAFRTAFIKGYGRQSWERFNDRNIDPGNGEGNATLTLPERQELLEGARDAKIEVKGETATCTIKARGGKETVWQFVKVQDGWRVAAITFTTGAGDLNKSVQSLQLLAELLPRYQRAIGQKSITGDDIDVELGKAFSRERFGIKTRGARFDVNQFKE